MYREFQGYFEDFNPDMELTSPSYTVTEGDLANFISISGDYHEIYTSEEFAKGTMYRGRVLPSTMIFALATGLYGRIKGTQNHMGAMLGQNWQFPNVARIGDTLVVKVTYPQKRKTRHPDRGIVTRSIKVINQNGKVIATSRGEMMIGCKET